MGQAPAPALCLRKLPIYRELFFSLILILKGEEPFIQLLFHENNCGRVGFSFRQMSVYLQRIGLNLNASLFTSGTVEELFGNSSSLLVTVTQVL